MLTEGVPRELLISNLSCFPGSDFNLLFYSIWRCLETIYNFRLSSILRNNHKKWKKWSERTFFFEEEKNEYNFIRLDYRITFNCQNRRSVVNKNYKLKYIMYTEITERLADQGSVNENHREVVLRLFSEQDMTACSPFVLKRACDWFIVDHW